MSNCKELWIARRKYQHIQPAGKDHLLRKRDGVPQRERDIYIYREIERERDMDRKRENE